MMFSRNEYKTCARIRALKSIFEIFFFSPRKQNQHILCFFMQRIISSWNLNWCFVLFWRSMHTKWTNHSQPFGYFYTTIFFCTFCVQPATLCGNFGCFMWPLYLHSLWSPFPLHIEAKICTFFSKNWRFTIENFPF